MLFSRELRSLVHFARGGATDDCVFTRQILSPDRAVRESVSLLSGSRSAAKTTTAETVRVRKLRKEGMKGGSEEGR